MKPFDYFAPQSLSEAIDVLTEYGSDARILAGGTDLLIELRRPNAKNPQLILDISSLAELRQITSDNDSITINPLATHHEIMLSRAVRESASLLLSAASMVGSPQIRNLGTIGGNIMNAATCADGVPPLIALGADVTLLSKKGTRQLPL